MLKYNWNVNYKTVVQIIGYKKGNRNDIEKVEWGEFVKRPEYIY